MNETCWLAALEFFDDYGNDWATYEAALYTIFKEDFLDSHPFYKKNKGQRETLPHRIW